MKKLSKTKLYKSSRSTTFILIISSSNFVWTIQNLNLKIWELPTAFFNSQWFQIWKCLFAALRVQGFRETPPQPLDVFHHKLVFQPRKHRMKDVEFLSIFSEKQDWSSRPAHPGKSNCIIKSAPVQLGYPPRLIQFITANTLVVRGDAMTAAATY